MFRVVGKITLGGTQHTLNADFSSLTLLLASNLDVSPRYCASLLQAALSSRSRYPLRSPVEIALILYQRERWALTEAWKQLVTGAVTLPQEQGAAQRKLGSKFSQALQALLSLRTPAQEGQSKRNVSLPERLLLELDSLKTQIRAVEAAVQNPPSNPSRRLPDEIQLERLSALAQERRSWAHVLYLLSISSMLEGSDIIAIVRWLSKIKEDEHQGLKEELLPYVLTALLSALETSTKTSLEGMNRPGLPDLLDDRTSLNQLDNLINKSTWSAPPLQAVVQLQWSLLLVQVVKFDPSLGAELQVTEDSVSRAVLRAVQQGDAFVYIVVRLLGWRQKVLDALEGLEDEESTVAATATAAGGTQTTATRFANSGEEEVDIEFQPYLLSSLQTLLLGTSRTFLTLLRRIQRQEEDGAFSASRSGSTSGRRYDLEAFLDGIALVVRGDESRALSFWLSPDGRKSRFITWAVELREDGHQRALIDLLSAMSSGGADSAWQAHTLLSSTQDEVGIEDSLVSWNRLWDWMAYYIEALKSNKAGTTDNTGGIPPSEAALLRSFLRLLKSVASGSFAAREALLALTLTTSAPPVQQAVNPFGLSSSSSGGQSGAGTNVLQRLFALYLCPVPIELKASILDALAAFAKEGAPGSGASGRTANVRQQLWQLVDSSGVLASSSRNANSQQRFGTLGGFIAPQESGVRYELENVEAPNGLYPGTISFINFLAALVVPDVDGPAGRTTGDVNALVADLPATSAASGQIISTNQLPLGVPALTGAAAQGASDIGLEKYLSFVIDSVLLPSVSSSGQRDFAHIGEKWRLLSASLHFLDRCLSAYDLTSLSRPINGASGNGPRGAEDRDTILRLAMHPGFGVMKRLMGLSKLLHEVLAILSPPLNGSMGIASNAPGYEVAEAPIVKRSAILLPFAVRASMRITLMALRNQDLFSQVLLPTLSEAAEQIESGRGGISAGVLPPGLDLRSRVGQSASYTSIDAKLLQEYESVVQMALYVNSSRDDLAFLSVKLLEAVASSRAFSEIDRFANGAGGAGRRRMNRLVGLLEMTEESGRVREGVLRRLDALRLSNDEDDSAGSTTPLADDVGYVHEEYQEDSALMGTTQPTVGGNAAICRAILDLLLANTGLNKTAPNIAHLLLGFDLRAVKAEEQVIPTPGPEVPRGVLHCLLDLLRKEADSDEDETTRGGDQDAGAPTLLDTYPALAEKSLALLLNLSLHPFTTSSTLRYLRTQEDFWTSQLRDNYGAYTVPVERSTAEELSSDLLATATLARGALVFPDGRSLHTSVDALVASLKSRQHLLSGVALELHGLIGSGMQSHAARLVGALYGAGLVVAPAGSGAFDDEADASGLDFISGRSASAVDTDLHAGMRLLGFLQSFDFDWHDERDGLVSKLSILRDLDISQARSIASSAEFDIGKTIALLAFARRELERLGELTSSQRRASFDQEAAIVLQHVSARNAHKAIAASRSEAVASWRNVQDLVLSHSSSLFRSEARMTVIFDCLAALLPRLEGPAPDEDPVLADLAAGAILSLLTSLRRHRAETGPEIADLSGEFVDELPTDRLLYTLRALVGALLRSGTSISARGNLYSALINYLQLARSAIATGPNTARSHHIADDELSLISGDGAASAVFSVSGSVNGSIADSAQPSLLESKSKAVLAQNAERLIPTIARDALDAPDVWRTVCFTLLDKLCALESLTKQHTRSSLVIDILARGGFLKSFVGRLRDMDLDLQEVLRPDPSSLNALYVYEAMMAFFARLSQSVEGAHRLLEAKLFDVFAQADFLAAKPEQDQDFVDLESFLPAATERYGAMLLPALQVLISVATSASASHRSRAPILGHGSFNGRSSETHGTYAALQSALSLLNAHRDSLLSVIRSAAQDTTSLATVEQSQLVVTLMLQVLPILDDEALSTPNPLAAYHSGILALAASFLHSASWKSRIVPFTENEREEETILSHDISKAFSAPGNAHDGPGAVGRASQRENPQQSESVFDVTVDRAVSRLLISIASYLEAASETFGKSGSGDATSGVRPCFTSSLAVPQPYSAASRSRTPFDQRDELDTTMRRSEASGRLASVPSLGMALAAMDEQVALLEAELSTSDRIRSMLESSENVRLEEWDNVARQAVSADESVLAEMGLAQRKAVATRELKSQLVKLRGRASQRLDVIDVLLVLVYRHFSYYLALVGSSSSGANAGPPTGVEDASAPWRLTANTSSRKNASTFAPGGAANVDTLLDDGGQMVQLVLERLGRVLLTINSASSGAESASSKGSGAGLGAVLGGVSRARERTAFLELVGRKLQTLLLVRDDEE